MSQDPHTTPDPADESPVDEPGGLDEPDGLDEKEKLEQQVNQEMAGNLPGESGDEGVSSGG